MVVAAAGGREAILAQARRCEALGFDSLWLGDHIAFHVPIPESLALLAFLAAATERVMLGTSVYLLPLRPPVLAAKTVATVDVLSGGRTILGVGVGGEFPPEFDAVGVPRAERGSRTDEAIGILRRLWREDGVVHAGRHFRFGPVTLAPKPAQPGGPPIWVGGRKAPALRRAGALGDGFISHMASPEMYRQQLGEIARHAERAGRSIERFGAAAFLFAVLDDDRGAALDRADRMLSIIYARPFRDAAAKYCLLGPPNAMLEQMRSFAAAGARHFILSPLSDPVEFAERIAERVLPEVPGLGSA
jgi:probable F420-dependent oxidoreductase